MSFCFLFSHIQQINLPLQNSFIVFSITFFSISVHRFLLPDGEFFEASFWFIRHCLSGLQNSAGTEEAPEVFC